MWLSAYIVSKCNFTALLCKSDSWGRVARGHQKENQKRFSPLNMTSSYSITKISVQKQAILGQSGWNRDTIHPITSQHTFKNDFETVKYNVALRYPSWFVIMPIVSQIPKLEVRKNQQWARRKYWGFGGSVGRCNRISVLSTVVPIACDYKVQWNCQNNKKTSTYFHYLQLMSWINFQFRLNVFLRLLM